MWGVRHGLKGVLPCSGLPTTWPDSTPSDGDCLAIVRQPDATSVRLMRFMRWMELELVVTQCSCVTACEALCSPDKSPRESPAHNQHATAWRSVGRARMQPHGFLHTILPHRLTEASEGSRIHTLSQCFLKALSRWKQSTKASHRFIPRGAFYHLTGAATVGEHRSDLQTEVLKPGCD